MYEENPYPRWMTTAARTPRPVATVLRTLFPRFDPPAMLQGPVKLLIAGCGTGKQAIDAATRYRDARVLAVDLSLASLSYALRQADSLGVANVDFRQGDILALGAMEDRFAVIECVGVLMAIAEPLAAWRILVDLLQPRGVMKLGLYSETARRHIVAVRDLIAAAGYPATPEGIRRCRQDLIALPPERPERAVLDNRDFYSLSTCRDLIFHVQEHRFTLPQIADALDALGLDFLGFELDNPTALAAYRAAHPEDTTMTDLAAWHAFEQANPETFTGMYQFWCQKR
jgi:SAM-dependent methyltransferase